MGTYYATPLINVALCYLFTLYIGQIYFPYVHLQKKMNEAGDNIVSYSTCGLKYLLGIDIVVSDIDIGDLFGQVFIQVCYIYIGAYDINIGALQGNIGASHGQVFVQVNYIYIRASNIDIGAS